MSAVATRAAQAHPRARGPRASHRLFEPGRVTLDERISAGWRELVSEGRTDCPVCGGEMRAATGCGDCGSTLA